MLMHCFFNRLLVPERHKQAMTADGKPPARISLTPSRKRSGMEIDMSFGDNLRTLIEEHNMTQKELAAHLNIAPSTIGSYVQNTREPDFSTLKSLAKYFDVSIDYLLDYTSGEKSTHNEREMLRIFRSLSKEQQYICIEQCKVFLRMNHREKEEQRKSS